MIRITTSLKRLCIAAALTLSLTACMGADNPVPLDTISQLEGAWEQNDGTARVQFYADETVKLNMPDEQPPVRLLSVLETIKDEKIGFGVNDRWHGPIHVVLAKDAQSLQLIIPGEPDRTLDFHKSAR